MDIFQAFLLLILGIQPLLAFPGCPGKSYEVKEYAGTCNYFPSGLSLKYDAAKAYCIKNYGEQATIPTILSEEDNKFYSSNVAGMGWIALVREKKDGPYVWEDGSKSSYRNWHDGNPEKDHHCAYMNSKFGMNAGKWYSFPCNQQGRKIMCKSGKVNNWRVFNDFEYFAMLQAWKNITWADARAECMKLGADLLSIQTNDQWKKVNEWLKESAPDLGRKQLWIGLKTTDGSSWKWSDRSRALLKYWKKGYPIDTFTGARCAIMTRTGYWMNTNCGIKQSGYICKRPVGTDVPITLPPPTEAPGYCPNGYQLIGNKCFKVITSEKKTWEGALKHCRKERGRNPDLASIHNKMDTASLASQLSPGQETWLGGTRHVEGRWGWTDGSVAGEYNYFSRSPGVGDCLHIGKAEVELGRWTADFCNETKGFICQTHKDPSNPIVTPAPQLQECPDNYVLYDNFCYRLTGQKMNWTEAYSSCKKDGASLISIVDEAENNAVYVQVLKLQQGSKETVRLWIGYQDLENSGKYSWIDGHSANFTRWTRNEPRRKVNGGCVAFREGSQYQETGIWEDKECHRLYPAICKRHSVKPTSTAAQPLQFTGAFFFALFVVFWSS